jgi:hypothetical protein
MKREIIYITLLVLLSVAVLYQPGCSGVKNVATIAGAGTVTHQSFDNVYDIIQNNIDAFSPRDVVRLRSAGVTLVNVKSSVDALVKEKGSAIEVVSGLADLIPLYEQGKIAYVTVDDIVMSQIDEFDRQDQMTLYAFQDNCQRLDAAITDALNSGGAENAQLARDILGFVILVGKVVLPLLIL